MNPYDIDYSKFQESKPITDEGDRFKLRLLVELNQIIENLETEEILSLTGLSKIDLAKIRISSFTNLTADRIINIFDQLGYKVQISIFKSRKE